MALAVGFERFGDFLWQDIEQQRLRAFLEEVSLPDEIVEKREDDGDHAAEVQDEEPGNERLGQSGRRRDRARRMALTIRSRTKPTIQSTVWRRSSTNSETSGQSAAQMITALEFLEAAQAHHHDPRQHKGHEKLGEAVEAEVAGPAEKSRVDRGDERIDRGRRSGEGRPGGEVDHRPEDGQRKRANGSSGRADAAATPRRCSREDRRRPARRARRASRRGGRPAEPADVRLVTPHGFPSRQ